MGYRGLKLGAGGTGLPRGVQESSARRWELRLWGLGDHPSPQAGWELCRRKEAAARTLRNLGAFYIVLLGHKYEETQNKIFCSII